MITPACLVNDKLRQPGRRSNAPFAARTNRPQGKVMVDHLTEGLRSTRWRMIDITISDSTKKTKPLWPAVRIERDGWGRSHSRRRSDQALLQPFYPLGEFFNVRAQSAYLVSVGKIDQGDGLSDPSKAIQCNSRHVISS